MGKEDVCPTSVWTRPEIDSGGDLFRSINRVQKCLVFSLPPLFETCFYPFIFLACIERIEIKKRGSPKKRRRTKPCFSILISLTQIYFVKCLGFSEWEGQRASTGQTSWANRRRMHGQATSVRKYEHLAVKRWRQIVGSIVKNF